MSHRTQKHEVPPHLFKMKGLRDPKDRAACRRAWELGLFSMNPLAESQEQYAARYSQAKYDRNNGK